MARMDIPVVDKCCFVLELKTGCMILGVVNSILTFVMAVILITFAVDIKEVSDSKRDDVDVGMYSVVYTIVILLVVILFIKFFLDLVFVWAVHKVRSDIKEVSDSKRDDVDVRMYSVVYTIMILLLVLLFVKFFLDLVFVWALHKIRLVSNTSHQERSGIIKKYCIFWIVFLVLNIIGFLKTLFQMGAGHVISQIFFLAENFYYIVVIRSYLISINEDAVL